MNAASFNNDKKEYLNEKIILILIWLFGAFLLMANFVGWSIWLNQLVVSNNLESMIPNQSLFWTNFGINMTTILLFIIMCILTFLIDIENFWIFWIWYFYQKMIIVLNVLLIVIFTALMITFVNVMINNSDKFIDFNPSEQALIQTFHNTFIINFIVFICINFINIGFCQNMIRN